ncbi:MAG: LiaI-LiaF-like domain-containing protein [Candidatus Aminicenantales bacterium]
MTDPNLVPKRPTKSPVAAGILSGFFPGVGALYNGQYSKGILYMVVLAGLITLQDHGGQPFFGLLLAGFYVFQIIESINSAKAINRVAAGESVPEGTAIPAPLAVVPSPGNSIFWGALLMALGGIFLLGNFDVIDYDRLWDFWPVIVIIIGIKMIADYFSKKNA